MTDIKPGSFGLSIIEGKSGKLIEWGQDIVDDRIERYTHAFFVLDNNEIIEAQPGGAEIVSLDKYTSRPDGTVLFCDKPVQNAVHGFILAHGGYVGYNDTAGVPVYAEMAASYEQTLRADLVRTARTMGPNGRFGSKGIQYSYLDYLAIGLDHFHINIPWVNNRVRREDRMICSQLVDWIFAQHGLHLFNDGRLPQAVTPGNLESYALGIL